MDPLGSAVTTDDGNDPLETELKYVLPAQRTPMAAGLLQRLCDPDPEFHFGIVSSIYYDTMDWELLEEKRNSDYLKTKVRLRWYKQPESKTPETDRSFVEIKRRIGAVRTKMRMATRYQGADLDAMDLGDRRLLQIPHLLLAAGAPVPWPLFPAFVVRYCRRRYIEKSTRARIAIDYAITAPKVNRQMIAGCNPCSLACSVLEVKGTSGKFPVALQGMLKLGFRRESFSKYFECYSRLTGTRF